MASIVATETLLIPRSLGRRGIAGRARAEVLRFPVPDTPLIGPGDELELAVAVPVDRRWMDAVPPELQWLAVLIPQDDFGTSEDGVFVTAHVLGEQYVASAIGAAVLRTDAQKQVEHTVAVPVDHVDLRPSSTVSATRCRRRAS